MPMHEDEISISVETVRRLVVAQFPQWADRPIGRFQSSGTVNAIFRIGTDLAARLPLRPGDPAAVRRGLEDEARASAEFLRCSPFPGPTPVGIGDPGEGYPLPWSVQTWLPGRVAADGATAGSLALAHDLAMLIAALRAADTGGRVFERGWRGGDLHSHDPWVQTSLRNSRDLLDVPRLAALWSSFVDLPRTSADVMSHGDLTPSNVLVTRDRLVGLLDCGGFGPADPALDLIAGWHLLDDEPRAAFRDRLCPSDLDWERGKAWAFEQSIAAVWYYADTNPAMAAMGRRTMRRIVESEPG